MMNFATALRFVCSLPVEGLVEVDESYFGGARKGKRGRGAAGKVPVFGILKRGGKVYTRMIADASSKTLLKAIKSKVLPDSIVYTDSFGSYDALDVSEFKHRRVEPLQDPLRRSQGPSHQRHRELLEPGQARASQIQRHSTQNFYFFLKECEFRFNYGKPSQQLRTLKRWALDFYAIPSSREQEDEFWGRGSSGSTGRSAGHCVLRKRVTRETDREGRRDKKALDHRNCSC